MDNLLKWLIKQLIKMESMMHKKLKNEIGKISNFGKKIYDFLKM